MEVDYPKGDTLRTNTTDGNAGAGIDIFTEGTQTGFVATLIGNTANKNQFGLYYQIQTKGSGNHANGNKIVNCHNVACAKDRPQADGTAFASVLLWRRCG